ncbi:YbaK/EbsC family protein [Naasia lichenicola]|uniref:YbaK/EbsC family protein n=1 Tax=Naasia lichenicola TaxID=2565933 RepID=A0A4S4FRY1_9MICO|nr:YbaK/EbsC family protein [Naasia lichenicola]THG33134.1 YbaK/EbsC family protein [Naasia lichenicola]
MHRNAERFRATLLELGESGAVQETAESAHTAADAAAALGVPVAAIVKSLVFEVDGAPVIVLASGPNRVDTELVGGALGGTVGKATAAVVKSATGYSIGGVPPFGYPAPLPTLIDEDLLALEILWAAAGMPNAVFPISPARLVELTGGTVARIH